MPRSAGPEGPIILVSSPAPPPSIAYERPQDGKKVNVLARTTASRNRPDTMAPAEVAELADALDSKSSGAQAPCGFDSHLRHRPRRRGHAGALLAPPPAARGVALL